MSVSGSRDASEEEEDDEEGKHSLSQVYNMHTQGRGNKKLHEKIKALTDGCFSPHSGKNQSLLFVPHFCLHEKGVMWGGHVD